MGLKELYANLILSVKGGGEDRDYTKLSIGLAILLLAVPMVLEMFFEALFAIADAYFVALYVGINGVAMVGMTEAVMNILYSLAWGVSGAATAIIARRAGEGNQEAQVVATFQVMLISTIIGLCVGIPGYFFAEQIMQLMGASPDVISQGLWYAKFEFLSAPVVMLLFSLSGALRGAGKAVVAMYAVIIANLINIGLDYLFVGVFHFGVKGAAIATIIGRSFGVVYLLNSLMKDIYVSNIISMLRPVKAIMLNIIKIAAGSTGQFLIQSASWVFLVRIIAQFGSETVAGYTIAVRIIIFTILPSWGLGNAAATLLGQNMGANQIHKGIRTVWIVALINGIFMAMIQLLFYFNAAALIALFDTTPEVIKAGQNCLTIFTYGYILFGIGMVMIQAINGAGDTLPPTLFNLFCYWIIQIPLAYYLGKSLGYGADGAYYAVVISESIWAIIGVAYFMKGKWQKISV